MITQKKRKSKKKGRSSEVEESEGIMSEKREVVGEDKWRRRSKAEGDGVRKGEGLKRDKKGEEMRLGMREYGVGKGR